MSLVSKSTLRTQMRAKRQGLSLITLQGMQKAFCWHLESYTPYLEASVICFFCPIFNEPNLMPLVASSLSQHKIVAFPNVSQGSLSFHPVASLDQLTKGSYGILEPPLTPLLDEPDLILTPLLAVDKRGDRIGSGKGYYDQYFAKHPAPHRLGIAYAFQQLPLLPCQECHDQRLHALLTENGIQSF